MKIVNEKRYQVIIADGPLECSLHFPFFPQTFGQLDVPINNENESVIDIGTDNLPTSLGFDSFNLRQTDESSLDTDTDTEEEDEDDDDDDDDDDEVKWTPSSSPLTYTYGVEEDFNEALDDEEMQHLMGVLDRIMSKKTKQSVIDVNIQKLAHETETDQLEWEFEYFIQEDPNEEDATY